jgi:hypothetical protein
LDRVRDAFEGDSENWRVGGPNLDLQVAQVGGGTAAEDVSAGSDVGDRSWSDLNSLSKSERSIAL